MSESKKYDEEQARKDTNATKSETKDMWHQAREDARASGELHDRPATTASSHATNEPIEPDIKLVGDKTVEQQQLRSDLSNIRENIDTSDNS